MTNVQWWDAMVYDGMKSWEDQGYKVGWLRCYAGLMIERSAWNHGKTRVIRWDDNVVHGQDATLT